MSEDQHALFDGLTDAQFEAAFVAFDEMRVAAGTPLIAEYDMTDSMFVLEDGQVSVTAGGSELASLGPGAVLGEIGLFTLAVRTASVTAREPSLVRKLTRDAYDQLRDARNPVAFRIERRATRQLARRLRQQVASIQAAALATPSLVVQVAPEPASGLTAPLSSSSAIVALLSTAGAFAGEPLRHLRRLSPGATLRVFGEDEIVTDIEDDANTLHILLGGRIECLTQKPGSTRRSGMVHIGTVGSGELFDICPTADGQGRPMLYVTRDTATVLSLDGEVTRGLFEADTLPGSVLRQALVRSLFSRLNTATETLKSAHEALVAATQNDELHEEDDEADANAKPVFVKEDFADGNVWDTWFEGESFRET